MFIFGGKTSNSALNDLHSFDFGTRSWREIEVSGRVKHLFFCYNIFIASFTSIRCNYGLYREGSKFRVSSAKIIFIYYLLLLHFLLLLQHYNR